MRFSLRSSLCGVQVQRPRKIIEQTIIMCIPTPLITDRADAQLPSSVEHFTAAVYRCCRNPCVLWQRALDGEGSKHPLSVHRRRQETPQDVSASFGHRCSSGTCTCHSSVLFVFSLSHYPSDGRMFFLVDFLLDYFHRRAAGKCQAQRKHH